MSLRLALTLAALTLIRPAWAEVYNLKVVTDANPDYHDLPSLVHSATSRWETPAEKCWAMFYWNHIARRQTNPISLHGMALTDPIRQFNDYGYTMCSTISGINQSIWEQMGLKHRYWDISNHTVSEVFYDGRWHCYDNSLSAIYTLCDGKTIAGVEDIGKEGACEASGGKSEPGHIARYHCLTATSPRGFLTGADTMRSLDEEFRCFNPRGLKRRDYYYDWDYGHRYILNVRPGESYIRHYTGKAEEEGKFIPNPNGKDPEKTNPRYRLRGNGAWSFKPSLVAGEVQKIAWAMENITPLPGGGISPAANDKPGSITFRVSGANVIASQRIGAMIDNAAAGQARLQVSRDNGLHWIDVPAESSPTMQASLVDQVNGAYEVLVRVVLKGASQLTLKSLEITTTTAINAKTQPRLNLGKNTVYVGAGEQTDSIVYWPELQNDKYKEMIVEEKNIKSAPKHPGYMGTIFPAAAKEDAYVIYRIDAPRDIVRLTYGGRFYNRAPRSHIDLLHSFDGGKTWQKSWTLTETAMPWDVIHYETIAPPAGVNSVLVKYLMNTTEPKVSGCSIYAVRMEANCRPIADNAGSQPPVVVRFAWKEVQKDRSMVSRSHVQVVDKLPAKYAINVGGEDHPIVESLTISQLRTGEAAPAAGYSDGKDTGGEKFVGTWQTLGRNIAVGKKYTLSHPSKTNWNAGDPEGAKLTDGVAGPSYAGGGSYAFGALWEPKTNPTITLDLGQAQACASIGLNFHGYPWHDALKGQIKDKIEVLVSDDGKEFKPIGLLNIDIRWKDIPFNHMWTDEETMTGGTFRFIPEKPVTTRFVQFRITNARIVCVTEIEVLHSIEFKPFDLKIALPEEGARK